MARDPLVACPERDESRGDPLDPAVHLPQPGDEKPGQLPEVAQDIEDRPLVVFELLDALGQVFETVQQGAVASLTRAVLGVDHDGAP